MGILPKQIETNENIFIKNEENLINNIIEKNNILNKDDKEEKNKSKNEIICTYDKQEEEINILNDFSKSEDDYSGEDKEFFLEAKNVINEKNIEIYINDKKIIFNYKYKSEEI